MSAYANQPIVLQSTDAMGRTKVWFRSQIYQNELFALIFDHPSYDNNMAILAGGAVGGGKSKTGVASAIGFALKWPGSRIYITRKDFADLRDTTYKDFISLCPPELIKKPKGSLVDRVEPARDVLFANGSLIMFRELKDIGGKFGLEVNFIFIDQVEEIDRDVYRAMETRLRPWPGAPKSPFIMLCTANPSPTWVKENWIDTKKPHHHYIHFSPRQNLELLRLRPNYIKNLEERFPPAWVRRYVDGDWNVPVEGAIFYEFDKTIHVIKPFNIPETWPRWMALDPHLAKPFYSLWAAQAPDGPTFFYHELVGKEKEKSVDYLNRLLWQEEHLVPRKITRIIDYSLCSVMHPRNDGETLWEKLSEVGLTFQNAKKKKKFESILRVKELLSCDPPLLYIFDNCTTLISQMVSYKMVDGHGAKEVILKKDDDLVDTLQYIINEKPWAKNDAPFTLLANNSYLPTGQS